MKIIPLCTEIPSFVSIITHCTQQLLALSLRTFTLSLVDVVHVKYVHLYRMQIEDPLQNLKHLVEVESSHATHCTMRLLILCWVWVDEQVLSVCEKFILVELPVEH